MSEKQPYKILANKYRPGNFSQLIGQDFLVKTLTNAINSNRIANAFILNGIRGVGKTTTARIIALALNCTSSGKNTPTTDICNKCSNCLAITNYSHPDVIEIDAASHTGVDDIREIINNAKYLPTSSRYKVYIIDEVHMLSKNAFNALLKTLEEPPQYVKFIFATTEINKIPITVVSRCQRFDLRMIEETTLTKHLFEILKKEGIEAEEEAISTISRIAAGSVRDSISLLDQAIAYGNSKITVSDVNKMTGLVDYNNVLKLFQFIVSGNTEEALQIFKKLYILGANPSNLIQELMEISYVVTKFKILKNRDILQSYSKDYHEIITELSLQLKTSYLIRLWQLLIKSLEEIREAKNILSMSEMIIIKLCFISNLPSPLEVIKKFNASEKLQNETKENKISINNESAKIVTIEKNQETEVNSVNTVTSDENTNKNIPKYKNFLDFSSLVFFFKEQNEHIMHDHLMNDVSLVSFKEGEITLQILNQLDKGFISQLSQILKKYTGIEWKIEIIDGNDNNISKKTIAEEIDLENIKNLEEIKKTKNVQNILELFPNSQVVEVKNKKI